MKTTVFTSFLFLLTVIFSSNVYSQIEVVADGRLQTILEKHIEYNLMAKTSKGFRIKTASFTGENAKNQAFSLKAELQDIFPNHRCYVFFDEPNFIVKIGDFPSRLDAYAVFVKIKPQLPEALIIQDYINSPVINKEDLQTPEYFEEEMGE